ncbi:MAG: 3-dehydroquinate synthase [Bacteroidota bacterium]|jgi:3-dehydroquinate synthase
MISSFQIDSTTVLVSKSLTDFENEIHSAFNNYTRVFLLMDENTHLYCFPEFLKVFPASVKIEKIVVDAGEQSKSLAQAEKIWQHLFDANATKSDCLVALGGGVVSDLGGFVAALYKRGMKYFIFPTSLMAMTDAAFGGKTGVDFLQIKNSIGVLYAPEKIMIAISFLNTLDEREYKNGLAEIYKHAIVADNSLWNDLKSNEDEYEILLKSIAVKAKVVNKDFYENGERKILNFGHTIGHALESYALVNKIELLHGEAIVVGMMIETELAFLSGLLSKENKDEIINVLSIKFENTNLPIVDFKIFSEFLLQDKKNTDKICFSLPTKIGHCEINQFASLEEIKKATSFYLEFV